MNSNKVFIIVFLCAVLIIGIFMTKSKAGLMTKNSNNNAATTPQAQQGDAVITEGAQKQAKQESYTSGISLQITQPQPNTTVSNPTITVSGKTSPNADVFVNDKELKANATGNFTTTITLDEGENPIIVVANDADGNSAEQQILVTYQAQ